jgi:hypothetical protein
VDDHTARLNAGKDLGNFFLVESLDLLQGRAIVADAFAQWGAGSFLLRKLGKAIDYIAEGEFVCVAEGIALEVSQKSVDECGVVPGCICAETLLQLVETVAKRIQAAVRTRSRFPSSRAARSFIRTMTLR